MTKEKQVILKINSHTANFIREVLFTSQIGYSYDFPPERITHIRKVIEDIDSQISS